MIVFNGFQLSTIFREKTTKKKKKKHKKFQNKNIYI